MFAVHRELGVAGVAVRRRGALLARGRRRTCGTFSRTQRSALAFAGALLIRRRRISAAAARAAATLGRTASFPRFVTGAGAALAAVAPVASVGRRLDAVVAAPRVRSQFSAVSQLGGRLVPDATVTVPRAIHPRGGGTRTRAPACTHARACSASRGLAREPLFIERVRQQERLLVTAQPQQPRGQRGGVAAAAVPRAAARARPAPRLRGGGRGLGGRALRVGPRVTHADALHTARTAPRRGGPRARYEGGVPRVPQTTGVAPRQPRAADPPAAARAAR